MSSRLAPDDLDEMLALQLTVAWAGEAAGEGASRRLGWWGSDLVDPEGGGDLFARLVPNTAPWASLVLVREAARAIEHEALAAFHDRDAMWTPFHFGFAIDEQLSDRLAEHRRARRAPGEALGERFAVGMTWTTGALPSYLERLGTPSVDTVPNARQVTTRFSSPVHACRLLCAALLPLEKRYPLPYCPAPKLDSARRGSA